MSENKRSEDDADFTCDGCFQTFWYEKELLDHKQNGCSVSYLANKASRAKQAKAKKEAKRSYLTPNKLAQAAANNMMATNNVAMNAANQALYMSQWNGQNRANQRNNIWVQKMEWNKQMEAMRQSGIATNVLTPQNMLTPGRKGGVSQDVIDSLVEDLPSRPKLLTAPTMLPLRTNALNNIASKDSSDEGVEVLGANTPLAGGKPLTITDLKKGNLKLQEELGRVRMQLDASKLTCHRLNQEMEEAVKTIAELNKNLDNTTKECMGLLDDLDKKDAIIKAKDKEIKELKEMKGVPLTEKEKGMNANQVSLEKYNQLKDEVELLRTRFQTIIKRRASEEGDQTKKKRKREKSKAESIENESNKDNTKENNMVITDNQMAGVEAPKGVEGADQDSTSTMDTNLSVVADNKDNLENDENKNENSTENVEISVAITENGISNETETISAEVENCDLSNVDKACDPQSELKDSPLTDSDATHQQETNEEIESNIEIENIPSTDSVEDVNEAQESGESIDPNTEKDGENMDKMETHDNQLTDSVSLDIDETSNTSVNEITHSSQIEKSLQDNLEPSELNGIHEEIVENENVDITDDKSDPNENITNDIATPLDTVVDTEITGETESNSNELGDSATPSVDIECDPLLETKEQSSTINEIDTNDKEEEANSNMEIETTYNSESIENKHSTEQMDFIETQDHHPDQEINLEIEQSDNITDNSTSLNVETNFGSETGFKDSSLQNTVQIDHIETNNEEGCNIDNESTQYKCVDETVDDKNIIDQNPDSDSEMMEERTTSDLESELTKFTNCLEDKGESVKDSINMVQKTDFDKEGTEHIDPNVLESDQSIPHNIETNCESVSLDSKPENTAGEMTKETETDAPEFEENISSSIEPNDGLASVWNEVDSSAIELSSSITSGLESAFGLNSELKPSSFPDGDTIDDDESNEIMNAARELLKESGSSTLKLDDTISPATDSKESMEWNLDIDLTRYTSSSDLNNAENETAKENKSEGILDWNLETDKLFDDKDLSITSEDANAIDTENVEGLETMDNLQLLDYLSKKYDTINNNIESNTEGDI